MAATGKTAQIADALLARLKAFDAVSPPLPVAWPEVTFDRSADAPDGKYLEAALFFNRPRWEGLAAGKVDQGLLQVTVCWPKGAGLIGPSAVAALLVEHFAKGTELFSGATKVKISTSPWSATPLSEPDQLRIPVTIPWSA